MKKEEVIEELTKIYNQNRKINKNLIYEHSKTINKPLYQRMIEHFGNIDNMYSELGFSKTKRGYNKKEVNSDDILDIINKCYNDNAYVSKELLYLYSNIKKINILKYFKTKPMRKIDARLSKWLESTYGAKYLVPKHGHCWKIA